MHDLHKNIIAGEYFEQIPIVSEMRFAALFDEEKKKPVESETGHWALW